MALGGVPYYLKYVTPGLSAAENIQNIFFANDAPLKDEFLKLFNSLFSDAKTYIELIKQIAKKRKVLVVLSLKKLQNYHRVVVDSLNELNS